jgi:hypothetical protein
VCLIARHLEAAGIPTFCLGSALDIMQAGRPPRAAFVDFPLGHSSGPPFDEKQQYTIVRDAMRAFQTASAPETIVQLNATWPEGNGWKTNSSDTDQGDTRAPRDMTPRYQTEEDRIEATMITTG